MLELGRLRQQVNQLDPRCDRVCRGARYKHDNLLSAHHRPGRAEAAAVETDAARLGLSSKSRLLLLVAIILIVRGHAPRAPGSSRNAAPYRAAQAAQAYP